MGNRNSAASQPHDKDFGSPDSRGRSWSFHGIKSRKAGSKGASSFRGRSSSLSDAATSKGRKGADVVVTVGPGVPIPNGKASEGPRVAVAPGSVPLRPKWRPGGKGAGGRGEGRGGHGDDHHSRLARGTRPRGGSAL